MNSIQDIYKIGTQMKKIHKKVNLLNKKQTSFGLTAEEEEKLQQYRTESWLLHEELIETHMNISVVPYLMTVEISNAIEEIQKVIPWDGGLIRRDEDLEAIYNTKLTEDQKQFIADKLEFIHVGMVQRFELFCSSEMGMEQVRHASKIISTEEDGNILDVLVYLDARYREFGELLDIELQEVEIMWEDE
jgi:uncharacterized protein YnzC (UPF0291/DUF896 family)